MSVASEAKGESSVITGYPGSPIAAPVYLRYSWFETSTPLLFSASADLRVGGRYGRRPNREQLVGVIRRVGSMTMVRAPSILEGSTAC